MLELYEYSYMTFLATCSYCLNKSLQLTPNVCLRLREMCLLIAIAIASQLTRSLFKSISYRQARWQCHLLARNHAYPVAATRQFFCSIRLRDGKWVLVSAWPVGLISRPGPALSFWFIKFSGQFSARFK